MVTLRKTKKTLASPDSYDTHTVGIKSVNDPKRWVDDLPEEGLTKLRHDPADYRVVDKRFDLLKNFRHQPFANIRYALFIVPGLDLLQIA